METIQAFLKEYDHIPPNEKCMALLLVEERFLKIKQVMEEEQNQPKVMQELLLKLMNDLQILKGIKPKSGGAADFDEIKHAFTDEHYQQEDIQELISKLLEDVRNINEELSEYINCPNWNRPTFLNEVTVKESRYFDARTPRMIFLPEEFVGEHDLLIQFYNIDEDDCDVDDFDKEEGEIDIDILQIEDEILREKLLNVNLPHMKDQSMKLHSFYFLFA
ncbi:hypothetical protein Tco_0348836 [Tanacetum coccineum]